MADPIAVWGAVTGTTGLGLALRREVVGSRRSMRVDRGWQYVSHYPDGRGLGRGELKDVWVYVMAHNTGRRPLHIEHVGWEYFTKATPEAIREAKDKGQVFHSPEDEARMQVRVEIALNGETLEVLPDGPSVKIYTRIGPLLGLGIDPLTTPVAPYVVSVPEKYWWGTEGPLLPEIPGHYKESDVENGLERIKAEFLGDDPVEELIPGMVYGLPRLMLQGDVEYTDEAIHGDEGDTDDTDGDESGANPR